MSPIIAYIIKSTLSFSILFLAYLLLFRNENRFKLNRFILIAIVIISTALPTLVYTHKVNVTKTIEAVKLASGESVTLGADEQLYNNPLAVAPTVETEKTTRLHIPFNGINLLLAIYLLGVSLFLLHTLFHLLAMSFQLHRNNRKEVVNGITILVSDRWKQTFSYFGKIVMTPTDFNSPNRDILLSHELTHVRQHHSLDLLFAELFIAFHWFNPLVYIFKKSLSEVHEYLADEQVVGSGTDPIAYQQFILQCVTNSNIPRVANTFSAKLIKNRFAMMTSKGKRNSSLRYLLFIPALIGIFFLFSFKIQEQIIYEYEEVVQEAQEVQENQETRIENPLIANPVTSLKTTTLQDSAKLQDKLEQALGMSLRAVYSTFINKGKNLEAFQSFYATEGAEFMIISIGVSNIHPTIKLQSTDKTSINPIERKDETGYRLEKYKFDNELQFNLIPDATVDYYLYAIVVEKEIEPNFDLELMLTNSQTRIYLINKGETIPTRVALGATKIDAKKSEPENSKPSTEEKNSISGSRLILTTEKKPSISSAKLKLLGPFILSERRSTIGEKDYYSYAIDIKNDSITFDLEIDSTKNWRNPKNWINESNIHRVAESLDTEPWPFTYIQSNIRYPKGYTPKTSNFDDIEVQFNLSETAEISNVRVIKGVNPQLDAEVVRVVKSIPDLKPERIFGKYRAVTVKLGFSLI